MELAELFYPLIGLYTPVEHFMPNAILKEYEGDPIGYHIHWDWQPFTTDNEADTDALLEAIFGKYDGTFGGGIDLESWVEVEDEWYGTTEEFSEERKEEWREFCDELIYNNRFFPSKAINLDVLNEHSILESNMPAGDHLFRSRISKNGDLLLPENMGAPPQQLSQSGRANPKGIPYLYLATDIQTALIEVRPKTTDLITIGRFILRSDLKIFDMSNPKIDDPVALGEALPAVISRLSFYRMLGEELSRPINEDDKELLYIPTQYLCEYIKNNNYDGVAYKSGYGPGKNIALFDSSKVECAETLLYKINAEPQELQCSG
jgi:hypothetical protein